MHIRYATERDRSTLEAFARAVTVERNLSDLFGGPVDWATINISEQTIALVAEEGPEILGAIIFALVPHALTGAIYADQMLWYVMPGARHRVAGPALLDVLVEVCLTRHVTNLRVIQPADRPRMARYLRHRGAKPVDVSWFLPVTGAP